MTMNYSPGYSPEDTCLICGEHLESAHSPGCPAAVADELREYARRLTATHEQILHAGGYQRSAIPQASRAAENDGLMSGDPAQVSHLFLAVVCRVGAELVEMDQADQINLDQWDSAAHLVAYLTGEADPFQTNPRIRGLGQRF